MTSEGSKRREFLSLIFISKSIQFLVAYFTEGGRLGTVSKYGFFYLLSFPGVYSFQKRLREGLVLLSEDFGIISL